MLFDERPAHHGRAGENAAVPVPLRTATASALSKHQAALF